MKRIQTSVLVLVLGFMTGCGKAPGSAPSASACDSIWSAFASKAANIVAPTSTLEGIYALFQAGPSEVTNQAADGSVTVIYNASPDQDQTICGTFTANILPVDGSHNQYVSSVSLVKLY